MRRWGDHGGVTALRRRKVAEYLIIINNTRDGVVVRVADVARKLSVDRPSQKKQASCKLVENWEGSFVISAQSKSWRWTRPLVKLTRNIERSSEIDRTFVKRSYWTKSRRTSLQQASCQTNLNRKPIHTGWRISFAFLNAKYHTGVSDIKLGARFWKDCSECFLLERDQQEAQKKGSTRALEGSVFRTGIYWILRMIWKNEIKIRIVLCLSEA